jgi:hypothetical protein
MSKTALIDADEELWLPIVGYEGLYEISSHGRVKSHVAKRWGGGIKILSPVPNGNGYVKVTLRDRGRDKRCYIHRLVASAFLPNPLDLPEVNHLDGVRDNNNLSNLEWVDKKSNALHNTINLNKNRGEKHGNSKLTEEDVFKIRKLLAQGYSSKWVSNLSPVKRQCISAIGSGKLWGWLK